MRAPADLYDGQSGMRNERRQEGRPAGHPRGQPHGVHVHGDTRRGDVVVVGVEFCGLEILEVVRVRRRRQGSKAMVWAEGGAFIEAVMVFAR